MSTDISSDKRVADLVQSVGLAAVPLYTWAIPHAQDDATLPEDPEEFLSQVAPLLAFRGLISLSDTEAFIREGLRLGLIEKTGKHRLRFPLTAFYKYQAYVKDSRRSDSDGPPLPPGTSKNGQERQGNSEVFPELPGTSGDSEDCPEIPGKSGKNRASFMFNICSVENSPPPVVPPLPVFEHEQARAPHGESEPTPIHRARRQNGTHAPSPVGRFIDAVKALAPDMDVYTERAHFGKRLKDNPQSDVDLLAEAYVSFRHGKWPGTRMLRETGNPAWLVGDELAYKNWRNGWLDEHHRILDRTGVAN